MQAALEQAVVNALVASLGYVEGKDVARCFDGRPHPKAGERWVSVWSDGRRESNSRSCLDEVVGVNVTLTGRLSAAPFDRWVTVRDDVEARLNRIRALVFLDTWNHGIINAAAALADLEASNQSAPTKRVGYREALAFLGYDAWQEVGPDWFHASGDKVCGVAQTARFGRARRIQAMATMG
jgi:hypothetical protein